MSTSQTSVRGRTWIEALRFAVSGNHPKRLEIAWTYLLLRLRIAVSKKTGKPLRHMSLLGTTVYFDDASVFSFLFFETFFEGHYLTCTVRPTTILDCGSNIGMSVMLFKSLWPDCRITAVEPVPDTFALLQRNVSKLPGVTLVNNAVSNCRGSISFYSGRNNLLGSVLASRGGANVIRVNAIPISQLIDRSVDLLKIDVEGSEIAVFDELEGSGRLRMVKEMFIEYHHHVPGQKQQLAEFLNRLERFGFTYELAASLPATYGGFQDLFIHARQVCGTSTEGPEALARQDEVDPMAQVGIPTLQKSAN